MQENFELVQKGFRFLVRSMAGFISKHNRHAKQAILFVE